MKKIVFLHIIPSTIALFVFCFFTKAGQTHEPSNLEQYYIEQVKSFPRYYANYYAPDAEEVISKAIDESSLVTYGPTEATIVTTSIEITKELLKKHKISLPVGYPKFDGEILIQNHSNKAEEEGEIVIVGDHVAI